MAGIAKIPFTFQKYEGFGGNFVDSQYLGYSYDANKPHVFEGTLMRIYSANSRFFTGKPLMGMTGGKTGGIKEIESDIYRWMLQGAEHRSATVVEYLEAGNTTPGINHTPIRIKLSLDYFAAPDVLFGEDNNYPLEIIEGPIQDGNGYIYVVKLQGDNPSDYVPPYLLEVGKEFDKAWTTVSDEFNEEFGTQQFPSSFKLESQVGFFAQKLEITDKALRQEGRLGIEFLYTSPLTGKTEKIRKFMPAFRMRMEDELMMSMEAQMTYGKKQTQPGHKNYWKKTGPGIREQLRGSWIEYYNSVLTTTRLRDYLMSVFFSRENEQDRQVVGLSGTLGSWMFHDMLAAEATSFLTVDTHYIQMLSKNPRHLSFGAQFTHYQGPEGVEVTISKNPMNDSLRYNKRMHPQHTDMPIDSARITFLDFGSSGGENNISMLKVKDSFTHGHTIGTVGPNGPVQGGVAGALIAGFSMFTTGSAGIWMKDPTRGGEFIFDDQY